MMKNTMTPTEAFAFRIRHEPKIKAVAGAVITATTITALVMLVLSPILLPLWLLEEAVKAVRK